MLETKAKLYASCLKLVDERVSHIEDAMRNAQASANEETKSSAGDKYETGRAMLGKKKGDSFDFGGKQMNLLDVLKPLMQKP